MVSPESFLKLQWLTTASVFFSHVLNVKQKAKIKFKLCCHFVLAPNSTNWKNLNAHKCDNFARQSKRMPSSAWLVSMKADNLGCAVSYGSWRLQPLHTELWSKVLLSPSGYIADKKDQIVHSRTKWKRCNSLQKHHWLPALRPFVPHWALGRKGLGRG